MQLMLPALRGARHLHNWRSREWNPPSGRQGSSPHEGSLTYGHLAPDAEDYERGLLDAFDSNDAARAAEGEGR